MPRSEGKFINYSCNECGGKTHSTPEYDDTLRPCVNTLKRKVDRLTKELTQIRKETRERKV